MNKYLSFVIIFLLAISGFFTIVPTKTVKADTELTVTGKFTYLNRSGTENIPAGHYIVELRKYISGVWCIIGESVTDSDGLNKGEYQIESGIHGGGNYKVRILSASSFENDVIVVEQNGTNYLYAYIAETEPKFIPAYEDTAVFQDHNIEDSDIKKAYWIKDALQEGYDYITLPGIYLAEWEPDWDITSHVSYAYYQDNFFQVYYSYPFFLQ